MRVLQICPGFPPSVQVGGAGMSAFTLGQLLIKEGHTVCTITPKLRGTGYLRSFAVTERANANGIEIVQCGTWMQRGFKTLNPDAFRLVPKEAVSADLVVIHGLRLFIGTLAAVFCRWTSKPYVVLPHGMAVPRWRSRRIKWVYDRFIGNRVLRGAAAVLCLSQGERHETAAAAGLCLNRVKVVSLVSPRNCSAMLNGPPGWERVTIAYLCRVTREKGIELMVDALAGCDLSSRYEIVVGGPWEDAHYAVELQRAAERTGVNLRFAGLVAAEHVEAFLNGSHLLALTSEFESWGRVAHEAIQVGTPVLVTDTCGVALDLSPAEGMVVPRTRECLRSALRELCADDFRKLRELRRSCASGPLAKRGPDVVQFLKELV